MLLRDRRLWLGVLLAAVLAVVSYSVAYGLIANPKKGKDVSQSLAVSPPATTSTTPPADRDVHVPAVVGQRLSDAKSALAALGLTNVRSVDATAQNRIVVDENNWIVEAQNPAADVVVDVHAQITLKVRKPTDAHSPTATAFGVVPDVVCANLQDAQNALRLSGFLLLTSTDGTGRGRLAIVDRNWVVTSQSVPAGTKPGLDKHIVLTVVKYGEPTGNPDCQS